MKKRPLKAAFLIFFIFFKGFGHSAALSAAFDALGQKIFYLSVNRAELVLGPYGYLLIELA